MCLRQVEAQTIFTLLQAERVTLACAAPTVLVMLANFPARDYRLAAHLRIGTGGSPPAAAVLRHMEVLGSRSSISTVSPRPARSDLLRMAADLGCPRCRRTLST